MILPSNDAFVANGDPMAHEVFSVDGKFVPVTIDSMGSMVLDAGTEVNDEIPENTAFFGQMEPNTGEDENSVVVLHEGFNAVGSEGILDAANFANADFTADGYQMVQITVTAMKEQETTDSPSTSGTVSVASRILIRQETEAFDRIFRQRERHAAEKFCQAFVSCLHVVPYSCYTSLLVVRHVFNLYELVNE